MTKRERPEYEKHYSPTFLAEFPGDLLIADLDRAWKAIEEMQRRFEEAVEHAKEVVELFQKSDEGTRKKLDAIRLEMAKEKIDAAFKKGEE